MDPPVQEQGGTELAQDHPDRQAILVEAAAGRAISLEQGCAFLGRDVDSPLALVQLHVVEVDLRKVDHRIAEGGELPVDEAYVAVVHQHVARRRVAVQQRHGQLLELLLVRVAVVTAGPHQPSQVEVRMVDERGLVAEHPAFVQEPAPEVDRRAARRGDLMHAAPAFLPGSRSWQGSTEVRDRRRRSSPGASACPGERPGRRRTGVSAPAAGPAGGAPEPPAPAWGETSTGRHGARRFSDPQCRR